MMRQILYQYRHVCVMRHRCFVQKSFSYSKVSLITEVTHQLVSFGSTNKYIPRDRRDHESSTLLNDSFSLTLRRRASTQTRDKYNRTDIGPRLHHFHDSCRRFVHIPSNSNTTSSSATDTGGYSDNEAIIDLFDQYAQVRDEDNDDGTVASKTLDMQDLHNLLIGIGRSPNRLTLEHMFTVADLDGNGTIDSQEFLENADALLGDSPARMILVIGGPGSGKGALSERLTRWCNVVHLSSGDLLRQEVEKQTPLGKTVRDIMSRGELVSSAIMVALMKKRMKDHPGKRVLLDGFPRSPENAKDLITLCGKPELALHLVCDDTILMERIMTRGVKSQQEKQQQSNDNNNSQKNDNDTSTSAPSGRREDDNFYAALKRLRTFHEHHNVTMEWLHHQQVPIINLDCTGSSESVWQQLVSIGKLMRPAVKLDGVVKTHGNGHHSEDWSNDPNRSSDDRVEGFQLPK